jgi:hypothetical protein
MEQMSAHAKRALVNPPHYSNVYVTYNGDRSYLWLRQACYGIIESQARGFEDEDEETGASEIIIYLPHEKYNEEAARFIIDEMFPQCFLTTSIEEGRLQGFKMNVERPYDEVLAAMIGLRACWNEYNTRCFFNFRKAGASIIEAMLLSEKYYEQDGKIYYYEWSPDHHLFQFFHKIGEINLPIEAKYTNPISTSDEIGFYKGVWGLFDRNAYDSCRIREHNSRVGFKDVGWRTGAMDSNEKTYNAIFQAYRSL